MAKVEDIIGQALLRISGGKVTPDLSVRRGEAKTYLAMAVNYVLTGSYWAESRAEGEKTVNRLFYNIFELSIVTDQYGQKYLSLPKKMVSLAKGRAIEVYTPGGKMCYPFQQGDDALETFYADLKPTICSYQVMSSNRVNVFNPPPLVDKLRASYWVEVADLADTDELLIPSDAQVTVVDMIVKFLLGEEGQPKDYTENNQDNAA